MKWASSKIGNSISYFLFSFLVFLLFHFCAEQKPTESSEPQTKTTLTQSVNGGTGLNLSVTSDTTKIKDKDKDKKKDSTGIGPYNQSQCQKVVNYWIFEKYENVTGKKVGIWPTEERWSHVNRLKELRDTLGFNYVLINFGWPYDSCYAAGYRPDQMLGGGLDVVLGGYAAAVQSRPTLWAYYTDEPVTNHGAGAQYYMNTANQWFNQYYPNSLFITGETTPAMADFVINYVDVMMCTRYCLDGDYFCFYPDQRPLWTGFHDAFGSKFSMTWIGAHKDLSTYDELIGHATNLGLDAIWLYQSEDATDAYSNNNVEAFAMHAWRWGWLRKVERKWTYVYECINQNPCDCDPYTLGGEWILVDKYPTYETRTVDY